MITDLESIPHQPEDSQKSGLPRPDLRSQTERERAALELLHAHRAKLGIAPRTAEDIAAENTRLLKADAERRAIQEGIRAWSDRRSKAGPAAPSAELSSVDQAARFTALADQLAATAQRVTAKPSDFAAGLSTYSRIGQELARRKLVAVSRLYDVFQHRARAQRGNAIATVGELVEYAAALGIGRGKVSRALAEGDGITWDALPSKDGRERLYRLRSKEQVCAALGLSWPGPRVDLPDVAYSGTLHTYLAHLYSAFFHGQESRRYARSTLQKLFGVSRRTLHALEHTAGVLPRPSYQEAATPANDFQAAELAQHRGARWWYTVREHQRPICSAGTLDAQNDARPNYQIHVDHVRQEAKRKPGRTLYTAWQEANAYEPGCTRLSASGRSRHIKRKLTTPEYQHKGRSQSALGGSSGAQLPRHFRTLAEAVAWQAKKQNRARVAAALFAHRAPMLPHRKPATPRAVTEIYAFQYSPAASFELPALPEVQQMRLLQRGTW